MIPDDTQLDRIENKLDRILDVIEHTKTIADKVYTEVKPTLDGLMASPVFKMLGMKK